MDRKTHKEGIQKEQGSYGRRTHDPNELKQDESYGYLIMVNKLIRRHFLVFIG